MIWIRSSPNSIDRSVPVNRSLHRGLFFGSRFILLCLATRSLFPPNAFASTTSDYPVYVSKLPNIQDYNLFANAGWDGNWFVGYPSCWIKKLPPIPPGTYARAFIGAKLGRMKLLTLPKKPWDPQAVPGIINMAVSSTASWTQTETLNLVETQDIPLDGSAEVALEGEGEAQWFWTEVPLSAVQPEGEHFLALWSKTPELLTISSSPVLAAGWGGKEIDSWLAKDIRGTAPSNPKQSLGTAISYFQPAMALKLIPAGPAHPVHVRLINWQNGTPEHLRPVITASISGESIERAWIEFEATASHGAGSAQWRRVGRYLWKAPYQFSLDQSHLPPGKIRLRVAAANVWEEMGASDPFSVEVSKLASPTK